jgi:hypothetical protein
VNGVIFAHLGITLSQDGIDIDLGLNRPAVTSQRHLLGGSNGKNGNIVSFASGKPKAPHRQKRHLKKLSGKLFQQRKEYNYTTLHSDEQDAVVVNRSTCHRPTASY